MNQFNLFTRATVVVVLASSMLNAFDLSAQISIDNTYSPTELINNFLVGSGVEVSNITFNMQPGGALNNQIGKINGPSQFFEYDEGIAMASGDVIQFEGGFGAPVTNISGDPDLAMLMAPFSVNNCAILEFDFVPNFEFLTVGYVFASQEYPGFTCSNYHDVFGFFVSGPGVSGQFTNNAVNIALIPNTDIAVGINSVNSGTPGFNGPENCLAVNPNFVQDSIYFQNNNPSIADDVQFPGMTVPLSANIILQPGETYHIKLAIADASDTALDSGVILEGSSFSAFPLSSVDELEKPVSLSVFPNPAADVLNVNIRVNESAIVDVRVVNSLGQVVMYPLNNLNVAGNHFHQMDVSSLSTGLYIVELIDRATGEVLTQKIQK